MKEALKRIPYQTKTADVDEKGIVTVAVNGIGIEDSQKDISMPGSFVNTVTNDIQRMRWFANHDMTQLLGVPLRGEEKDNNLIMTGQLNLKKQLGRDILEDYKLYAENGRTLEHSIGVQALKRDKKDPRKVLEWKMFEYSTLTSWGANPNTYLVGIKNATPQRAREAVDFLTLALRQKGYSDERYKIMETQLANLLKSLEGVNMVVCPHCGYEFDYDQAEQTTFQQIVLDSANNYVRWIAEDIVWEQINALEPAIREQVTAIIDAIKGAKLTLTEKNVADFSSYARCPHCYGKVYRANTLILPESTKDEKVETPQVETPKEDLFEALNKSFNQ